MTLPNVRWGMLYGILLCNARAMGEFGAVSVVSGHIRGETNTLPLHVEILTTSTILSALLPPPHYSLCWRSSPWDLNPCSKAVIRSCTAGNSVMAHQAEQAGAP